MHIKKTCKFEGWFLKHFKFKGHPQVAFEQPCAQDANMSV